MIRVKTQANGPETLQDFNHAIPWSRPTCYQKISAKIKTFSGRARGGYTAPPTRLDRPPRQNGKKGNRGSTLNFGDCSKTLGMPGSPHGRRLPQRNCNETLSIMGNRKSHEKTSRTRVPMKTTKSESFPRVWRGKVTTKRGTRSSCVTPTPNPAKKRLQNSATKIPRKGSENHQKGKTGKTTKALRNHAESSIHTILVHTRSSLPPNHPTLPQDLTMKLSS
jgi:hypothetical protein